MHEHCSLLPTPSTCLGSMYVRGAFFAHKWSEPSLNKGFQIVSKLCIPNWSLASCMHQCNLLNMFLFGNIEASRSFNFSFFVTKLVLRGSVLGTILVWVLESQTWFYIFDVSKHRMLVFGSLRWKQLFTYELIVSSPRVPIPLQIQKITIDLNCPWQSLAWGYLVGQIHLTHPFPHPCCIWCSTSRKLSLFIDCYSKRHSCYTMQLLQSPMNMTWRSLGLLKAKLASSKTLETKGKKIIVQEKTWTCNLVQ